MSKLHIVRDAAGHWLVVSGEAQKPIAVFYCHNVADHIARRRAEKYIKANSTLISESMRDALQKIATVDDSGLAEYTPQAMVCIARAALRKLT